MHVQINTSVHNGKEYQAAFIVRSVRKNGTPTKEYVANISKLPPEDIHKIRQALRNKPAPQTAQVELDKVHLNSAQPIGHFIVILELIRQLKLTHHLAKLTPRQRALALAMIVTRATKPLSKLGTRNALRHTALADLLGLDGHKLKVDHLYKTMDALLKRQPKIEAQLARRHLKNKEPVFYDITSVYFEGELARSTLVRFGYNRDKKKGKKQVVVGLVTDRNGYPVSVEVFPGNTTDQTTLMHKVKMLQKQYSVPLGILVGDRGMITPPRMAELDQAKVKFITALTRGAMATLIRDEKSAVKQTLFDEINLGDVTYEGRRYILCENPLRKDELTRNRRERLQLAREKLERLRKRVAKRTRKPLTAVEIHVAADRILHPHKLNRFFDLTVEDGRFDFQDDRTARSEAESLDGKYALATTVEPTELEAVQVRDAYKNLSVVEQAFRYQKTFHHHSRPVFHWTDNRIRCHFFLCMLAHYVVRELLTRLLPLLEADGRGRHRRWTLQEILEVLSEISRGRLEIGGVTVTVLSDRTAEQQRILDLLGVNLAVAANRASF